MAAAPKIVLTTNQGHLSRVDMRLNGLRTNNKDAAVEIARVEAAREDILSRMSDDEKAQYVKFTSPVQTAAEKKAQAELDRLAMEENRDKPSI